MDKIQKDRKAVFYWQTGLGVPKAGYHNGDCGKGSGWDQASGIFSDFYLMFWNVSPWILALPGWCHLWVEHSFVKVYLILFSFWFFGGDYYETYVDIIVFAYGILKKYVKPKNLGEISLLAAS